MAGLCLVTLLSFRSNDGWLGIVWNVKGQPLVVTVMNTKRRTRLKQLYNIPLSEMRRSNAMQGKVMVSHVTHAFDIGVEVGGSSGIPETAVRQQSDVARQR